MVLSRKFIKIGLLSRKNGLGWFDCYRSPQFSDLDLQQKKKKSWLFFLRKRIVTAVLSWVLSKNREGGDLFCFFCCDFTKVPRSAFPGLQVGLVRKEKHFPTPSEEQEGRSVRGELGPRISQWNAGRPSSSDRPCTTCPDSPCRTPSGTSCPLPAASLGWLSLLGGRTGRCECAVSALLCPLGGCGLVTLECLWRWLEETAKKCWSCCHWGWTWLLLEWSQGVWPGKRGQYARGRGWWEQSGSRVSSVLSRFWHKEFLFGWNLGWEK